MRQGKGARERKVREGRRRKGEGRKEGREEGDKR